jgi:hypothetical protein
MRKIIYYVLLFLSVNLISCQEDDLQNLPTQSNSSDSERE